MRRIFLWLFLPGACITCAFNGHAQTITYTYTDTEIITTLAGDSLAGYSGDGGPGINAQLGSPSGVATDRKGNVYIADQIKNTVRKVDAEGVITTVAGNDTLGYSGDGGPATAARLSNPTGVAVDRYGNIYIADQYNNVIRKVDTDGIISTFAGDGTLGFGGDGGAATSDSAMFWSPADVGVDSAGNVYVIDQDNNRVRKIDTSGILTTIAGTGLAGYSGDSGLATTAQLNFPEGIAIDKAGNVFIADYYNSRVRKVTVATGIITTVAGNGLGGYGGDDSAATSATLFYASAVALDDSDNIYISDYYNDRIRKVNNITGIITTIAGNGVQGYGGDGGPAVQGEIFWPEGIAVDSSGNAYIADYGNHRVRKVSLVTDTLADTSEAIRQVAASKFQVFPNPSSGLINIVASMNNEPYEVTVYNMAGVAVLHEEHIAGNAQINLANQPQGLYDIFIKCGERQIYQKITITR